MMQGQKGDRGDAGLGVSATAVIVAYLTLFAFSLFAIGYVEVRFNQADDEIRAESERADAAISESLIAGCAASRTAISEIYQREIDESTDPGQIKATLKFIPTITRKQLEEFKAEEVAQLKEYQATVDPDECGDVFAPPGR